MICLPTQGLWEFVVETSRFRKIEYDGDGHIRPLLRSEIIEISYSINALVHDTEN